MRVSSSAKILISALLVAALSSACADAVEVGSGAAGDEVEQVSVAQDQRTQSDLRAVLLTAMTAFVDNSSFDGAEALIPGSAPGICVTSATTSAGPSAGCPTPVSVYAQG